jgi:hypothetical protein
VSGLTSIDRISIRVSGVERDLGRRLGELVAQRLVPTLQPAPGEAALDLVRVEVPARPGEGADALAGRIATEISLAIARTEVPEAGR